MISPPPARNELRHLTHVIAVFRDALDKVNFLQPRLCEGPEHGGHRRDQRGQGGTQENESRQHQQSARINRITEAGIPYNPYHTNVSRTAEKCERATHIIMPDRQQRRAAGHVGYTSAAGLIAFQYLCIRGSSQSGCWTRPAMRSIHFTGRLGSAFCATRK